MPLLLLLALTVLTGRFVFVSPTPVPANAANGDDGDDDGVACGFRGMMTYRGCGVDERLSLPVVVVFCAAAPDFALSLFSFSRAFEYADSATLDRHA